MTWLKHPGGLCQHPTGHASHYGLSPRGAVPRVQGRDLGPYMKSLRAVTVALLSKGNVELIRTSHSLWSLRIVMSNLIPFISRWNKYEARGRSRVDHHIWPHKGVTVSD